MVTYSFYERNGVVQVRINGGKRGGKFRISLGIKLDDLTLSNNRVDGRSTKAARINNQIVFFENMICKAEDAKAASDRIKTYLSPEEKKASLLEAIEAYVEGISNGSIKSSKGTRLGKSAVCDFNALYNTYKEFGEDLDISKVDLYSLSAQERRSAIAFCTKHFNAYMDFLVDSDYAPGTQSLLRSKMSAVLNHLRKTMGIDVPGEIRPVSYLIDPIEIPVKYYEILLHHDVPAESDIDEVCDLAVKIQLQTVLRLSDVLSLQPSNIYREDGNVFVSTLNKKTSVRTLAALGHYEEVMKNIEETGSIYRGINMTYSALARRVNSRLKHIASKKIQEKILKTQQLPDGSVQKKEVRISDEITSHDLRRLAANYYLSKGASENAVKVMGGWVNGSEAFNKHYKLRYDKESIKEILSLLN